MSLRAIHRLIGIDRETLGSLILTVGENCQTLLESIEGGEAKDVEAD